MSFFTHLARAALSGTAMLTALAVGLLPDAGAQPQGRSGIDAASVSYTHLDVYKRQSCRRSRASTTCAASRAKATAA